VRTNVVNLARIVRLAGPGGTPSPPREPGTSFWRFAGAALAGNLTALGGTWAVRKAMSSSTPEARLIGTTLAGLLGFWGGAGVAWLMSRPKP
jgi:hypothetical protein